MVEDDIYKNKSKYAKLKANFGSWDKPTGRSEYYSKNNDNIKYFYKLCEYVESRDLSYVRRVRLINNLKLICFATTKDLAKCEREDIDKIMSFVHQRYNSIESKKDFVKNIKYFWRVLFPVIDEKGLPDERLTPHAVRHLSSKIDISKQKRRNDKLTWEEYEKILKFFGYDPRMQAYLSLAIESLGRPQEILYCKIGHVEKYDSYAKIKLHSHTKEGVGILQCIDSFPYLMNWLNCHPYKDNPEAFLFIHLGKQKLGHQLTPARINQLLKKACRELGIQKYVTPYSLKRNGVTYRRLRGDTDMQIQHAARWTSTRQLKTYDQSDQEDAFKLELIKRGIIDDESEKYKHIQRFKTCIFCEKINSHTSSVCQQCKRPLDRRVLREQAEKQENQLDHLKQEINFLKEELSHRKQQDSDIGNFLRHPQVQDLFKTVYKLQKRLAPLK